MKTVSISVRVEPKLKRAVEQQAEREGRSLANYVARQLRLALERKEATDANGC